MAQLVKGRQLVTAASAVEVILDQTTNPEGMLLWENNGLPMTININRAQGTTAAAVSNRDTIVYVPVGGALRLKDLTEVQFAGSYDITVGTPIDFSRVVQPGFFFGR